ncbi:DNA polymerase II [Alteromonas sp. a30]|uniref:DNA polymerase II n=1 Tax=Alteromonas sp. a30 TaxID=2730917 RepID=UPI002282DEAC|nr:DNA polymerase II [Alteromonas sp. a30]MCY7294715.1 DNA polymerase II [Alteromonas sp. a30]
MSAVQSNRNDIQQGFILTRQQFERNGHTFIELWLITNNGPQRVVTPAEPFVMFIETSDVVQAEHLFKLNNLPVNFSDVGLHTFQHKPVHAMYLQTHQQLTNAQACLTGSGITLHENDIRLVDRYLMERFIYGSASFTGQMASRDNTLHQAKLKPAQYHPSFRTLSLDIECSEYGELYSVGLAAEDYRCVLMIGDAEAHPESQKWIHWTQDEKNLLRALCDQINQYDPDIIVGWSVINFDFRVLMKRAQKHQVPIKIGRGNTQARWRDGREDSNQGFITIPGRMVVDGIDALKSMTYHFDSFSLEFVSQSLLGKGKKIENVHDRMAHINHDFKHNKVKLAEYNLQDCELVLEIFDHTQLLDFLILRSQLTGLTLDRIGGWVAAFTNLYLPKLHRAGYVSPNRPSDGALASPGGYVMSSKPGLYQHVLVLDFKSLYPSIIRTFKIDPMGLIEGLKSKETAIPGYKGAYFDRLKHFLPNIITSLWQQRDQAKKEKNAAKSQAIKILMNSFYGVLGSGGCRFYDPRLASSITMRGHDIMQTTAKWIEAQGFEVIYGDTDSTFVWLNGDYDMQQAHDIGNKLATHINYQWRTKLKKEFGIECHLELEFETYFSRFLMPTIRGADTGSKKRYAGVKSSAQGNELIFKGLETVRSDWTELAKEFQQTLYAKVFNEEPLDDYIQQTVEAVYKGEKDHQLIYKKRLRQPLSAYVKNVPPHVKAARIADQHNQAMGRALQYQNKGDICYVFTTNGAEPEEYRQSPIDYEHYIEKQLKPVADAILPFISRNFDEITSRQLGLF